MLSVDPSSPISGGSILGDKTRMERLAVEERAFIRPSPSRGHLGGVARRTRETILLCEAAGYRNILVETVGVGQSETAVRSMADFFLLLMLAGAGDELQGMKRGIIEMIDGMAINKADGDNRPKAERARVEYAGALHLFPASADGWTPRVLTCSALHGQGIAEIWQMVLEHRALLEQQRPPRAPPQPAGAALDERTDRRSGLEELFRANRAVAARLPALQAAVRSRPGDALRRQPRTAGAFVQLYKNERRLYDCFLSCSNGGRSRRADPATGRPSDSADSRRPARRRRFRWRSPTAPIAEHDAGREFQIGVLTGASTGPSLDGALAKAKRDQLPHALPDRRRPARPHQRRARRASSTCTFR